MSEPTSSPISASTDLPDSLTMNPDNTMLDSTNFNYDYLFLLIAILFVVSILISIWFSRRRRQKSSLMRHNSLNALERDIENSASRRQYNGYRAWRYRLANGSVHRLDEGLNERGEAPPPYSPDDKPPATEVSIESDNIDSTARSSADTTQPDIHNRSPPRYEYQQQTSVRPPPAVVVTASSEAMSDVEEEMYRNAASRMQQYHRSSMPPRRV